MRLPLLIRGFYSELAFFILHIIKASNAFYFKVTRVFHTLLTCPLNGLNSILYPIQAIHFYIYLLVVVVVGLFLLVIAVVSCFMLLLWY